MSGGRRYQDLAKIDPAATILVSWREVERALGEACQRHGLKVPSPPLLAARVLVAGERLDIETYKIFAELRSLRNQAQHENSAQVTEAQALDFVNLALRLAAKIDVS